LTLLGDRGTCVNNLPKVVTRQCPGAESNLRLWVTSGLQDRHVTVRLPSHISSIIWYRLHCWDVNRHTTWYTGPVSMSRSVKTGGWLRALGNRDQHRLMGHKAWEGLYVFLNNQLLPTLLCHKMALCSLMCFRYTFHDSLHYISFFMRV